MIKYFAGIDVQLKRGCCYYIIDQNKKHISSGWEKKNIAQSLKKHFLTFTDNQPDIIAIGIDAPRMPLEKLRNRYFDRQNHTWYEKSKKCKGRECEVIIKSYRIANPQWTNTFEECPDWMKLGFEIFLALKDFPFIYEVFPSASYKMFENENIKYEICLNHFPYGVKDMLDASVGAITVYEFVNGRGCEVGGEDKLGTIILPRLLITA